MRIEARKNNAVIFFTKRLPEKEVSFEFILKKLIFTVYKNRINKVGLKIVLGLLLEVK